MQTIENKITSVNKPAGEGKMAYSDLIKLCTDRLPKEHAQTGWTAVLQKESFRAENAVKNAEPGKEFEVEDNDALLIKKFCVGYGWPIKHQDLIDFDEYIKNLKAQ
mgnify:FL=1